VNDPDPPSTPAARLGRTELAAVLTARGYRISKGSLDQLASRNAGPPYSIWGKAAVYDLGEALRWAEARLQPASAGKAA
jgi:hypothetical protein